MAAVKPSQDDFRDQLIQTPWVSKHFKMDRLNYNNNFILAQGKIFIIYLNALKKPVK
jgi:hypothetical protein